MTIYALKIIAIFFMLAGNIEKIFLQEHPTIESLVFLILGAIVLPIIIFLLVEGLVNSEDQKKFIIRLAILAVISEIPYDLAFHSKIIDINNQNLIFTLLISAICIRTLIMIEEKYKGKILQINVLNALSTLAFSFLAAFLSTEFSFFGVLLAVAFFLFRGNKGLLIISTFIVLGYLNNDVLYGIISLLSMAFIWPYKGEKGKDSRILDIFYPAHLLILYAIKLLVF